MSNNHMSNNHGYTLTETLIAMALIGIIGVFSFTGLNQWKARQTLERDIKNTHLSLEFAGALAALNQKIFIVPEGNQLSIFQDLNSNNIPDDEDRLIHQIRLETNNIKLSLSAFGEKNQWISLDPQAQESFQNFTLGFIQDNKKLPQVFTMSTSGDIQRKNIN